MKAIKINEKDTVAVLIEDAGPGEMLKIPGGDILLKDRIKAGHKVCTEAVKAGRPVIKYGYPIGEATKEIWPGEWVHTHNLKTGLKGFSEYAYAPEGTAAEIETAPAKRPSATFKGFLRGDGKVGIRNEIWIVPTVGCVNSIGKNMAAAAQGLIRGTIDGLFAYEHPYGCSQLGEDHENTRKALAGLVKHPNAGGILVLGLGCENNQIGSFKEMLGEIDEKRVKFLNCQDERDEIAAGLSLLEALCETVSKDCRTDRPCSDLIVGLKCGGSDGFSGITANPLVGKFSNQLIAQGGTAILTEVPEMFGAETILMNRCADSGIFHRTVALVQEFKQYFIDHNQEIYENPSPGNKDGGITTLEEKSLGCTQKSGDAAVTQVLGYGELAERRGLVLLEAPGNDLVASTALAVSGAQFVLFTTGRGTPFGAPVPTVKISSNTDLYNRKPNWIDFNGGQVLDGVSWEDCGRDFFQYALALASGEIHTKSEDAGIKDIAIFKKGITL